MLKSVEYTHDMLVLDKVIPGPLHLYLSCNEVINHCEKTCWPEVKDVLSDRVGVQVHVYQGKIGNYEGPSLQKIFCKLSSLEEFIVDEPKKLYFQTLISFRAVSRSVFGKELLVTWREDLYSLKENLEKLRVTMGLPITPKFHILTVHVEQWVDRNGCSLGKEGESSGEALHHIWKRLIEG